MFFLILTLLAFSCAEEPSVKDIEKALLSRYRWLADVKDIRVTTMVKVKEDLYFAQVKFALHFKKNIEEVEKEITQQIKSGNLYKDMRLLANAVLLKDTVNRCGRHKINRESVCYLSENVEIVNIRGSWVVKFIK